jgi:hypothetical protein
MTAWSQNARNVTWNTEALKTRPVPPPTPVRIERPEPFIARVWETVTNTQVIQGEALYAQHAREQLGKMDTALRTNGVAPTKPVGDFVKEMIDSLHQLQDEIKHLRVQVRDLQTDLDYHKIRIRELEKAREEGAHELKEALRPLGYEGGNMASFIREYHQAQSGAQSTQDAAANHAASDSGERRHGQAAKRDA